MNFKKSFKFYNQLNGESLSSEYKSGAEWAWNECKQEILNILKQSWTGADLSINTCDQHYISKIERDI